MILWLDAHVSPKLCRWIQRECGVDAVHVRDLGLREAEDPEIFDKAREAKVVLSKDDDFVSLVERLGPPPQVVWLTCGKVSNARLKKILSAGLPEALGMIQRGEPVVEITAWPGTPGWAGSPNWPLQATAKSTPRLSGTTLGRQKPRYGSFTLKLFVTFFFGWFA